MVKLEYLQNTFLHALRRTYPSKRGLNLPFRLSYVWWYSRFGDQICSLPYISHCIFTRILIWRYFHKMSSYKAKRMWKNKHACGPVMNGAGMLIWCTSIWKLIENANLHNFSLLCIFCSQWKISLPFLACSQDVNWQKVCSCLVNRLTCISSYSYISKMFVLCIQMHCL